MKFGWHVVSSRLVINVPSKYPFNWDATIRHRSPAPYAIPEALTKSIVRSLVVRLYFVIMHAEGLATTARQVNCMYRVRSRALGSYSAHM